MASFSARDDQVSFLARLWLERPTRRDRFWRGSLSWVDRYGHVVATDAEAAAFESAPDLVRLIDARLVSLGGPSLRTVRRD